MVSPPQKVWINARIEPLWWVAACISSTCTIVVVEVVLVAVEELVVEEEEIVTIEMIADSGTRSRHSNSFTSTANSGNKQYYNWLQWFV